MGKGFGNAAKDVIRPWMEARLCRAIGSQDEADAIGVALAGRAMVAAGKWDAAA